MSSILDPLADVFDSGRNLAPQAVGSQIVLMSLLSVVTVLVFNVLRPSNKMIYEPKVKYHVGNKTPPPISDTFFGWLPPLIHTKEVDLIDKIGLDAVVFLRFLHLMRWVFTGTAFLACGVLIPINWLYNQEVQPAHRDVLSSLTIRDVKGPRLYAHVTVTYLITFLVLILVYYHWTQVIVLRKQWFRSPEYMMSFYARTISIIDVPKKHQFDEGIQTILSNLGMPYPATSVHINRKVGHLPDLIQYHNDTVREFEAILVRYLKGGKISHRRPTVRIGGCGGCGGTRKDAIEFYTEKLRRTEAAVEAYRANITVAEPERFGFASLAAVAHAHIVARKLNRKRPKGTTITLAPNPRDIIWPNWDKSEAELWRRKMIGYCWTVIVCILSLIPMLPVATFANLDAIKDTGYIPALQTWSRDSPISYAIVSGVAPPALAALFTFFFPRIMRWLTRYMGARTHSRLDRAVIARFFGFLVISQLIIFTLLGVVFNSVLEIVYLIGNHASASAIVNNLNKLPDTINKTYINQASYWLKWFPFRGFLVIFDLAQILNLVWISLKTHLFGRTPRDIREWTQPPEFEYAIYYANLLFMSAVGLLFAPLAPLVALSAMVVFWLSSWLYKYQLMFVYVTKVETGGRLWNVVINRLLFSLLMMQALMVLTIGLQYRFHSLQWLSTVPPLIIVIVFKMFIKIKFARQFDFYIPTQEELQNTHVHSKAADARGHRLEHRFGHPALHQELFTPMLHAKTMPLLAEVYKGKIREDTSRSVVQEQGGRQLDTQIIEGIKIAYIEQKDLEYDPILYQRDRGEQDWDTASTLSSALLSGKGSMMDLAAISQYRGSYVSGYSSPPTDGSTNVNQLGIITEYEDSPYGGIASTVGGTVTSRPQAGINYEPRTNGMTSWYSESNGPWSPATDGYPVSAYAPTIYSHQAPQGLHHNTPQQFSPHHIHHQTSHPIMHHQSSQPTMHHQSSHPTMHHPISQHFNQSGVHHQSSLQSFASPTISEQAPFSPYYDYPPQQPDTPRYPPTPTQDQQQAQHPQHFADHSRQSSNYQNFQR